MSLTDTKAIKVIVEMVRNGEGSQGTTSSRMEVFRWLLKNGMNKVDIDESNKGVDIALPETE